MSFLCQQHLDSYKNAPTFALSSWIDFIHDGEAAIESGELQKALTFIGSAFDISQLLLNQPTRNHSHQALDRFLYNAKLLIQLFDRLNDHEQAKSLCAAVHSYLVECHGCLDNHPIHQKELLTRIEQISRLMLDSHMVH